VAVTQEITHLANSVVKLTFTYSSEDLNAKYNEVVRDVAKNLQIKGFRKGKAPVPVLERKLGKALADDVLNTIIGNTVSEAFKKEDFPKDAVPLEYSEPEVEGEPKLDLSSGLTFSVKYDTFPVVNIEKWEGFELESETAEVTDDDVERRLDEIRERNAIIMDKDEGAPAEKGDVVTIDYCELLEDGAEIDSAKRQDFTFTLGSGHNIYKFDDEIEGMKKGDVRDIKKSYPEDFEYMELAGKTKSIRVTLTALKRKELPDDDELAQDVDENFKNIADLKQDIRKELANLLEARLLQLRVEKVVNAIIEHNPLEAPESMIMGELFLTLRQRFGRGATDEVLKKIAAMPSSEELKQAVTQRVKTALILEKLEEDLKIEVPDEDMEELYNDIAKERGQTVEEIKKFDGDNSLHDYIFKDVRRKKLLSFLLEKNTVKAGKKVNFVDIFPKNF
jgi:trigger factor